MSTDCKVSHWIIVTVFEAGQYMLTDYLTGFKMGEGATNGCKSSQPTPRPALKPVIISEACRNSI